MTSPTVPSKPSTWNAEDREANWRAWERRFAQGVLANARIHRKELRLSAADLSARLTAAGWPVTVNSVNGIFGKKGRESLSITQLIALSVALETSPAGLLFDSRDEEMEITPGEFVRTFQAATWFFRGTPHVSPEVGEPDFFESVEGYLLGAAKAVHEIRLMTKGGKFVPAPNTTE